uniref:Mitochondrial inner membrane protein Mpv17 n=1 Tax=Panagrellus redivivus TaxID=6233 RepID=A0A7E4V7K5_PANRE
MALRALRWFAQCMHRRPLVTQCASSGILIAGGDIICQFGLEKCTWETYNGQRSARFFISAFFWEAPILSRWMIFLERIKGSSRFVILKRMVVDQLVFTPIFAASTIFNLRLLEGNTPFEAFTKLKTVYVDIMTTFYKVWPAILMFTYTYVPLNYRVVFIQVTALFWNIYFSYALHHKPATVPEPETKNN